jgi:hypothetical protein
MKITIIITAILLTFSSISFGQSQSRINFQAGTTIEVQTGASVCADTVRVSGTFIGGGTICGYLYTLNLTALIQGFYNPASDIMVSDTTTIVLRNANSPYAIIDSAVAVLDPSGNGVFSFAFPTNATDYYIVFKHRNSIETWSSSAIPFVNGNLTYDFTSASSQAYGNNLISEGTKYTVYSGDVNQDGFVNLQDVIEVSNAAEMFLTGYVITDVNGDNIVDLTDLLITYNNNAAFVEAKYPTAITFQSSEAE